ncbi:MAG TPA: hypothetical protein VFO95_04770 [Gemmatimonadales bacterium]|nr:hypothetical protein [Gemmatimonadales bacterium]
MSTLRMVVKELLPAPALRMYRSVRDWLSPPPPPPPPAPSLVDTLLQGPLFDGDDALFKDHVARSRVYGEYGCGKSTIWVAHHAACEILSVDASADWIGTVARLTAAAPRPPRMTHVDLGEVGDWGRPLTYTRRQHFRDYVSAPWSHPGRTPDVVLVDGRFRVASFLYSLLHAPPGTRIFFDDYVVRPYYHVVEEYCPPAEFCGRQALFVVPADIDRTAVEHEYERFLYVMD